MGQKGKAPHKKLIPLKSNLKFNKSYDLIIAVEPQGRGGSVGRAGGRHRGGESSSQGWLSLLKGSPSLPGHAGYCLATSWLPPGHLLACPEHLSNPIYPLHSSVPILGSGSGGTAVGDDAEHHEGAPPITPAFVNSVPQRACTDAGKSFITPKAAFPKAAGTGTATALLQPGLSSRAQQPHIPLRVSPTSPLSAAGSEAWGRTVPREICPPQEQQMQS